MIQNLQARFFSSSHNEYISDHQEAQLSPEEFVHEVILVLQDYFKSISDLENYSGKDVLGNKLPPFSDIHEHWEFESNYKIKELIRANSFTNQSKHIRLLDLMTGSAKLGRLAGETSPNEYFKSQFEKNSQSNQSKDQKDKKSESEKFI